MICYYLNESVHNEPCRKKVKVYMYKFQGVLEKFKGSKEKVVLCMDNGDSIEGMVLVVSFDTGLCTIGQNGRPRYVDMGKISSVY